MELIKITEHNGIKCVSARELCLYLGFNKTHWAKWYKKNVIENQFAIENQDYVELALSARSRDFAISLDFAKKICMMANTAKGDEMRDYFIDCEKKVDQVKSIMVNYSNDPIIAMRVDQIETKKRLEAQEKRLKLVEAKTTTRPDYFTIAGYATLQGMSVNLKMASRLGKAASKICKERGLKTDSTPDARYGVVKMYPTHVLEEVFNQAI